MPDYALMNQYLYEGKAKEVEQMTKDALGEGRSVQEVLNDGLIAGMSVVGEDFKHNVLYVPEVLIAARAMKAGIGGAPISQMFADEIGADGYGQNASAAVDLFIRLAKQARV